MIVELRSEIWIQIKVGEMVIKAMGVGEITHGECVEWEETGIEPLRMLKFKGQQRQRNQ